MYFVRKKNKTKYPCLVSKHVISFNVRTVTEFAFIWKWIQLCIQQQALLFTGHLESHLWLRDEALSIQSLAPLPRQPTQVDRNPACQVVLNSPLQNLQPPTTECNIDLKLCLRNTWISEVRCQWLGKYPINLSTSLQNTTLETKSQPRIRWIFESKVPI